MILYEQRKFHPNSFFQIHGSVFPFGLAVALPCGIVASILKWFTQVEHIPSDFLDVLNEPAAYSGFTFLVGFFIVFRTQQAYNRFHQGAVAVHEMRGEWFDSASSLMAFCKYSKEDPTKILRFQHKLIRLFSMLHAVALGDLEEDDPNGRPDYNRTAFRLPLIDAKGIDTVSLLQIRASESKVELVFQWIQQLAVENISTGVLNIPPPVLTRAFQELSNGMVKYHDALVIARVPFPFPYMQTSEVLLALHWIFTPLLMASWTETPGWAFAFCFVSVLFFWCLNAVACELENPFGDDANDLNAIEAQRCMNNRLMMLIRPGTLCTPTLVDGACLMQEDFDSPASQDSFIAVWEKLERELPPSLLKPLGNDLDVALNEYLHKDHHNGFDDDMRVNSKRTTDMLRKAIYDHPRKHNKRVSALFAMNRMENGDGSLPSDQATDVGKRHLRLMDRISSIANHGDIISTPDGIVTGDSGLSLTTAYLAARQGVDAGLDWGSEPGQMSGVPSAMPDSSRSRPADAKSIQGDSVCGDEGTGALPVFPGSPRGRAKPDWTIPSRPGVAYPPNLVGAGGSNEAIISYPRV